MSYTICFNTLLHVKICIFANSSTREDAIWTDAEIRLTTFGPEQAVSAEKVSLPSFPRTWIHRQSVIKYFWMSPLFFHSFFSRQEIFGSRWRGGEARRSEARRGSYSWKKSGLGPTHTHDRGPRRCVHAHSIWKTVKRSARQPLEYINFKDHWLVIVSASTGTVPSRRT